jgi:hypothetical protein
MPRYLIGTILRTCGNGTARRDAKRAADRLESGSDQLHKPVPTKNDCGKAAGDDCKKKGGCDGVLHGVSPIQDAPLADKRGDRIRREFGRAELRASQQRERMPAIAVLMPLDENRPEGVPARMGHHEAEFRQQSNTTERTQPRYRSQGGRTNSMLTANL